MYPLYRLTDRTVILAWLQAGHGNGVYVRMTTMLWQIGYVDATVPWTRRRLKAALKRQRLLPRVPKPGDYQRAFARVRRLTGDELI